MFEKALKVKENFMSAHYGMFRAVYQMDKSKAFKLIESIGNRKDADLLEIARLLYQEQ